MQPQGAALQPQGAALQPGAITLEPGKVHITHGTDGVVRFTGEYGARLGNRLGQVLSTLKLAEERGAVAMIADCGGRDNKRGWGGGLPDPADRPAGRGSGVTSAGVALRVKP